MKKITMLFAVLAMMTLAAVPAVADDNDNNDSDNGSFASQNFSQDADSGNVSQSFNVTGGGDNSNQCVGLQGVANTGNVQNQIGVLQYGSESEDLHIEDSGASLEVSPSNSTECNQSINQVSTTY